MMVIADTCIWSLALRRDRPSKCREVHELECLVRDSRVQMLGPIRQEILSGVRNKRQFDNLREHLKAFPDQVAVLVSVEVSRMSTRTRSTLRLTWASR